MSRRWISTRRRSCLDTLQLLAVLIALVAAASPPGLSAQAPADDLWELRLHDGSSFIGQVVSETADSVTFVTTGGIRLELDRAQIQSLTPVRGRVVDGTVWREDPNRTRLLLLSPTARTLARGEGYISAFWVVLPFVGYGVTDHFTMAAGTPLIPEVIGRVVYLAPKLRVLHQPGFDLAVGGIAFLATEAVGEGSIGIGYGVATLGDSDRSVSAGAGWAWAIGGGDDGGAWVADEPLIMLGGESRMGRNTKLLTENFVLLGESGALLTGGVRLFGEQLSVDFGIAAIVGRDEGGLPWFPVLNFVYSFGR